MTVPVVILRELHRLRRHAKDLQDQLNRAPLLLKAHQDKITRQEEQLHEAQDHLKKLKVKLHDRETSLKTTHQKIAKHTQQMNEAAGKKEYDALKIELAEERKTAQKLEDEILETMSEIEERTAELPEKEKAIKTAKEEQSRVTQESQVRQVDLNEQMQKALAQLKEAEVSLPDDIRQYYQRMVNAQGEDSMAEVRNRTCIACHTEITHQMVNDLLSGRMVPCKACGRLLYLQE